MQTDPQDWLEDPTDCYKEKMAELDKSIEMSIAFLCEVLEGRMQDIVPIPKYLPVRIDVVFHKKFTLSGILVQPFSSVRNLLKTIEKMMAAKNDPITDWKMEETTFWFSGPAMGEGFCGIKTSVEDFNQTIVSYNLVQGSILLV